MIRNDFDTPWKQIVEKFFEEFLFYYFFDIYRDIDFSRGYVVKSKELYKLLKDQDMGKRYTDELIKVFLNDGTEKWLFIHIEVQGSWEEDFAKRMYIYNYRIFDKYAHEVVSLAVLTDPNKSFRPNCYKHKRWGFELRMTYPMVKILDFKEQEKELEASKNMMAILTLAWLKSLELKKADKNVKFDGKMFLIRMLYQKGFSQKQIRELFLFIDWIISLPEILERKLMDEVKLLEEDKKMAYISHMERIAKQEGKKEGKKEEKKSIALKMLMHGDSAEHISAVTGLTPKEIEALIARA